MFNIFKKKKKKKIKKYKGFRLYDIVNTNLGPGVIMKFETALDRDDNKYMGALIRYTLPYMSYSFNSIEELENNY